MGRRLLHCAGAALVAMSYNPMSMLSLGRQEDILAGALRRRAAVVLLQGTRWEAAHPIEHWRCHGFEVFSCGYGTRSNRAAGVVVALHSPVSRWNAFTLWHTQLTLVLQDVPWAFAQ